MKVMYISFIESNDVRLLGVKKKIKGQIEVFKTAFETVYYCFVENRKLIIYDSEDNPVKEIEPNTHLIRKIGDKSSYYKEILDFLKKSKIEGVYIRYKLSCPYFIAFLKECNNINIKVVLEIPTYPYDKEITSMKTKCLDKIWSKSLKKHVDRIVTFSNHETIFGVKTIKTSNGIDLRSIKVRKPSENKESLWLLGVANVSKWHGYDRVILGLEKYYQKKRTIEIFFTVVGMGEEIENLKKLVDNKGLNKYVHFKGYLAGENLDIEFNNNEIGIVSLGIHRIGLDSVSTLKSKEYWARGLPMVKSYKDNDIDFYIKEAVLNVPANDEPLDMEDIIAFNNKINQLDLINFMTNSAESVVGWDIKMKPVIDYLKEY